MPKGGNADDESYFRREVLRLLEEINDKVNRVYEEVRKVRINTGTNY